MNIHRYTYIHTYILTSMYAPYSHNRLICARQIEDEHIHTCTHTYIDIHIYIHTYMANTTSMYVPYSNTGRSPYIHTYIHTYMANTTSMYVPYCNTGLVGARTHHCLTNRRGDIFHVYMWIV